MGTTWILGEIAVFRPDVSTPYFFINKDAKEIFKVMKSEKLDGRKSVKGVSLLYFPANNPSAGALTLHLQLVF